MNRKLIAILVSLSAVGLTASVVAGPACCSAGAKNNAEAVNASSPARMMLASYEKISNALAADNLADAHAAARTFAAVADITAVKMGCPTGGKKSCDVSKKDCDVSKKECGDAKKNCTKSLQAFLNAENIEDAREQFKLVSAQAIALAEGKEGFVVMTCPMAGENGDWLQSDTEVRNPYHGSRMLRCGKIKPAQEASGSAEKIDS